MILFVILGLLVLWVPLSWYLQLKPISSKRKAEAARYYAAWLEEAYPEFTVREAARKRYGALNARAYTPSKKDTAEMFSATLVMDGWHLWTGAQV